MPEPESGEVSGPWPPLVRLPPLVVFVVPGDPLPVVEPVDGLPEGWEPPFWEVPVPAPVEQPDVPGEVPDAVPVDVPLLLLGVGVLLLLLVEVLLLVELPAVVHGSVPPFAVPLTVVPELVEDEVPSVELVAVGAVGATAEEVGAAGGGACLCLIFTGVA